MKRQRKKQLFFRISIVLFFLGSFLLLQGIWDIYTKNKVYHYEVERKSFYDVSIKPNVFYPESVLPSGYFYPARALDFYEIEFTYTFQGNMDTEIEYDYKVLGDLVGSVENKEGIQKDIWIQNFTFVPEVQIQKKKRNQFQIHEKIQVDYNFYNKLARNYEKTYGILIDSNLKIHMDITYFLSLSSKFQPVDKKQDKIEIIIPLTRTITEAKENYQAKDSYDIDPIRKEGIEESIAGLCILVIAFLLLSYSVFKRKLTEEEKYQRKLHNILKKYQDFIIFVSNQPEVSGLRKIELLEFEDLISIAENLQTNILYYKERKNKNYFYVVVGDYLYQYVLEIKSKEE